jgi:hypothetical protein
VDSKEKKQQEKQENKKEVKAGQGNPKLSGPNRPST